MQNHDTTAAQPRLEQPKGAEAIIGARIDELLDEAQEAFWAVIAKEFDECEYGDFPPMETFAFDDACKRAAYSWVYGNMPYDQTAVIALEATLVRGTNERLKRTADDVYAYWAQDKWWLVKRGTLREWADRAEEREQPDPSACAEEGEAIEVKPHWWAPRKIDTRPGKLPTLEIYRVGDGTLCYSEDEGRRYCDAIARAQNVILSLEHLGLDLETGEEINIG